MPLSKFDFIRSTVLAILVGMAALLAIVGTTLWLVDNTGTYSEIVTHARQQRTALADLRSLMQDAETGQRGYLLTGNKDYLGPYVGAQSAYAKQTALVRSLAADDPIQTATINQLASLLDAKIAELQQTIDLVESGRRDEAMAIVITDRGRDLMDEARDIFDDLITQSEQRISTSLGAQSNSIASLKWVTLIGALIIILVVGGSAWTIVLYTRQLVAAQAEVRALNAGLEERVRERTADLGRANDEIQRFAYIVTHDLRAPLVNIMGFTSELERSLTPIQAHIGKSDAATADAELKDARVAALDDLPEAIGFIRSSTRKMDGLINAILKLSREGRRTLKPESIDLDALLRAAASSIQHQVIEAGGAIAIDVPTAPIVSDRLALEQIFGNLFDNAVKYRQNGRPLHIDVTAREERGQRIIVRVADNGRGVAAQDHDRVFDLFRRSGAQDRPGEGIGLAHVRTMVRNLGGEITLRSELEKGSTLILDLPRDLRAVGRLTGAA